jgi:hypothetical protein
MTFVIFFLEQDIVQQGSDGLVVLLRLFEGTFETLILGWQEAQHV